MIPQLEHRCMPFIVLLTGTANVLLIKWSDMLEGECQDGKLRRFQHPMVQTALMFLGELLCYFVYKSVYWFLQRRADGSVKEHLITRGKLEYSALSFVFPAFLDTIASILLFMGLYLTYAFSFQQLRAAVIIFVGIFSSIFLQQTLIKRHWTAMLIIAIGILAVINYDVQRIDRDDSIVTGDILILCAQVLHAAQIVYVEKYLKNTDISPMLATGLQGFFGLCITVLFAIAFTFIPMGLPFIHNTRGVFDDLSDVFVQLSSNIWLWVALCSFVISSGFYNYAAMSILKSASTVDHVHIDSFRVTLIVVFSLIFGWESFTVHLLMGYLILNMGNMLYRKASAITLESYDDLVEDNDVVAGGIGTDAALPTNRSTNLI